MYSNSLNDVNSVWQTIISELYRLPQDIHTIEKNGNIGIWFYAKVSGDVISVERAKQNTPSSKIKSTCTIGKEEFSTVYPYYDKWRNGSVAREFIRDNITRKSSYIFALIHKFDDDKN